MNPAHDTRLEIGGDLYWVRRDFDLMRRIEQAFGPLTELDAKLRVCALTGDDLVRLTSIALKAQASRPPDDDIREHVLEVGVRDASDQLALLVLHLFSGHKRAVAWLEAEAKRDAAMAEEGGAAAEDPPTAASSPGTTTSRRRRTSAGARATSGAPPITT